MDISIWQFQIQSGRGGSNPALRTLYYRLLRLHTLGIEALFVFDGPDKPPFKRNKRTSPQNGASLPNFLAKKLIQALGFPCHAAPGEAEAECAALQMAGVVDAVLSEDTDTMMFGATSTMKNWSAVGTKGNKQPTHINMYDAEVISRSSLDRDGMILIAMLSGGDYTPDGVAGWGVKVASEAARAGFGKQLLDFSKKDHVGLRAWKEKLQHELSTNESNYFRTKHKSLKIPDDFPDRKTLSYYSHPIVSSEKVIDSLRTSIQWNMDIDVAVLRTFVAEAFEWEYVMGARKLIKGLAPAILAKHLVHRRYFTDEDTSSDSKLQDEELLQQRRESSLIKAIHSIRTHFITDGQKEICISYVPNEIVRLDLSVETMPEIQGYTKNASEEEDSPCESDREKSVTQSPRKPRTKSPFDPLAPQKMWVLESFLKVGVPLTMETWEEEMRNPVKFATRKARARQKTTGMNRGAMDKFVKISKPGLHQSFMCDNANRATTDPKPSIPTSKNSNCQSNLTDEVRAVEAIPTRIKNATMAQHRSSATNPRSNPWTLAKGGFELPRCSLPSKTYRSKSKHSTGRHEQNANTTPPIQCQETESSNTVILISSSPAPREESHISARGTFVPDAEPSKVDNIGQKAVKANLVSKQQRNRTYRSPSSSPLPSPSQIFDRFSLHGTKVHHEPSRRLEYAGLAGSMTDSPQSEAPIVSNPKRGVMLRESLEGTWKMRNPDDDGEDDGMHNHVGNGKSKRRVFSRVSIVDLTTDD